MPSARQISWAKIRVVFVAVAALSILSVLVFLLTGGTLFQSKTTLYLNLPDATGLSSGSAVRVNGIDVGKIQSVALSGSNQPDRVVKLTLQIETRYLPAIPAGSYAQIETETAVGDKYINIVRGTGGPPAAPYSTIPFRAQPELIQTLDLEQFNKQLRIVSALLDQIEQGKNPTGQLLLSDDLWNQARMEIGGFERDLSSLRKPGNPAGRWLYTGDDYRRIQEILQAVNQALDAIESGRVGAGKMLRTDTQYERLLRTVGNLKQSIQRVRTAPLIQSDEMYANWGRELQSLIRTVDQIEESPLLSTSQMYDNLTGLATQLQNTLRDFRENPQKYLRIKVF
ncbi:MAG TPA: MlaD family protein [Bryobacteraceae bacterium]|nr:MlaD family protein [Bryobacteraceae bacterium]